MTIQILMLMLTLKRESHGPLRIDVHAVAEVLSHYLDTIYLSSTHRGHWQPPTSCCYWLSSSVNGIGFQAIVPLRVRCALMLLYSSPERVRTLLQIPVLYFRSFLLPRPLLPTVSFYTGVCQCFTTVNGLYIPTK
jgi:hypothetical protein